MEPEHPNSKTTQLPLCVDLDNTLISADLSWETVVCGLRQRPWLFFSFIFLLFRSTAAIKTYFASCIPQDYPVPLNLEVVQFITEQRTQGRRIILATGSHEQAVERIRHALPEFDDVLATTAHCNLIGAAKARALVGKFGVKGFDYIGDSFPDLHVFAVARKGLVANPSLRFQHTVAKRVAVDRVFDVPRGGLRSVVKQMRLYQWVKNALVLAPLLLAHRFDDMLAWRHAFVAFFAFSFCASAVYICNDLLDIPNDRCHPDKKQRPLAAGAMSVPRAIALAGLLFLTAGLLAQGLSYAFVGVLSVYFVVTSLYSFFLKKMLLVDVFVLAALYTTRLVAGSIAVDVPISPWLQAFSLFFFLSLAFLKRYAELLPMKMNGDNTVVRGRGYIASDLPHIFSLGATSGFLSILVFALYIQQPETRQLYGKTSALWAAGLILLYWIAHMWMKAARGGMHSDPIVFAIRNRESIIVLLLVALCFIIAL